MNGKVTGMSPNPLNQAGKKPKPVSNGRGARKNGRAVRQAAANTRHIQPAQNRNVPENKLSSRKIVWLEKIKLHLSIFACNARLKLGFYNNTFDRQALKKSISESELMLKTLKSGAALKASKESLDEAIEDEQYVAALRAGAKFAGNYIAHLPNVLRS